jgi:hypothetical protein
MNEEFKGSLTNAQVSQPASNNTETKLFSKSFDTTTALAGMYLWLLFGLFTPLLSCQLQRQIINNMYVKHLFAFITFFFLMTVVDPDNKEGIPRTLLKSFIIYVLFMLSTKTTLLFALLIVSLLITDQLIKIHMQYLINNKIYKNIPLYKKIRSYLYVLIIIIICIGYIHYFLRARSQFGKDFSYSKFIIGTVNCAHIT